MSCLKFEVMMTETLKNAFPSFYETIFCRREIRDSSYRNGPIAHCKGNSRVWCDWMPGRKWTTQIYVSWSSWFRFRFDNFRYWTSPEVRLKVCSKTTSRIFPDYNFCSPPIETGDPGPSFTLIPSPDNEPFQVRDFLLQPILHRIFEI